MTDDETAYSAGPATHRAAVRETVRENRPDLEALADTDLPCAKYAAALLKITDADE